MERQIDMIAKSPPLFAKINDPAHIYIYVIRNQDKECEILKLSNDLEIKEKYIIENGIGPGEARNPRIYGGDTHSLILQDRAGHKYIELDPDFKLIDEYREKRPGMGLDTGGKYLPEKRMVVAGYEQMIRFSKAPDILIKKYIRIYAIKFIPGKKTPENIKLYETQAIDRWKKDRMPLFRPVHFGYFFDHIYILDKREYRIIKMDIEGNLLKDKKFAFKSRIFSKSEREEWIEKRAAHVGRIMPKEKMDYPEKLFPACWLMPIADGIAVGKCENYDLDDKGPISADYFDPDLNYLGKITLPYFFWWNEPSAGQVAVDCDFFYKNGKLYFSEERDGEYWITRWDVKIEKNKPGEEKGGKKGQAKKTVVSGFAKGV